MKWDVGVVQLIGGCVVGTALGLATSVLAAEEPAPMCPICQHANDEQAAHGQKASATFVRGAMNTAFGWTELLTQPTEEVKAGGNLMAGIGKGIGFAVKRTGVGIGELLTFWTPKGKRGYLKLTNDCPICMGKREAAGSSSPR